MKDEAEKLLSDMRVIRRTDTWKQKVRGRGEDGGLGETWSNHHFSVSVSEALRGSCLLTFPDPSQVILCIDPVLTLFANTILMAYFVTKIPNWPEQQTRWVL
jgi:hypothetical protein